MLQAESSSSKQQVKEMMNFALRSIVVYTSKGFLTYLKILRHGAPGFLYFSSEGRHAADFLSPLKIHLHCRA
jgi:hypothetical protein